MIIVKLMGGLGNQMFQYAAGRCLAHLHKTDLKLDLSYLNADPNNKYTKREYKLDVFDLKAEFANENDLKPFLPLDRGKVTNTLMRKLPILFTKLVANESGHKFIKEFYSFPKHVYLNGFWQSELYFEPVKDLLIKEFTIKEPLSKENVELSNKIVNYNSVSLHIRRGDYITNQEANSFHGVCSVEYYQEAINYIKRKTNDLAFFVFSDDIKWCKENLRTDVPIHFIELGNPGHIDMHLMALCKHNIIANSSFSWWAAWLNQNSNKVIIAPKKWFANPNANAPDIYPDNWVKI